jgi:hypothetical protein
MAKLKVLERPYPSRNAEVARDFQKEIAPRDKSPPSQRKNDDLPQAPEIEKAAIASILQNPEKGFALFERIGRKGFFVNPVLKEIYESAHRFFVDNSRLDLIGFTAELGDCGRLKAVGGAAAVTELFLENAPVDALEYYLDTLREKYVRRQILVRSFANASKASNQDLLGLLTDMRASVEDLQRVSSGNNSLEDAVNYMNGKRPPMPPEVVHDLLHQGSKMVVGGTSKGRKTMALIDLAVAVTTATDWWGFRTRQGPICYINFEIQDAFFWYRVDEVCRAKAIEIPPGQFFAWNLRGHAEGLEQLRDEFISVLKTQKFLLVIIDPIYKALGARDENRAGDVASMLNEVEKIAVETGAAVAFGAHYSKGNQAAKESMDRIGGSGVFARDPDSILTMTAHEKEECFTVDATLRNFPPMRPFVVKWDWPLFQRETGDPNALKGPRGAAAKKFTVEQFIEELMGSPPLNATQLIVRATRKLKCSQRTAYQLFDEAKEKGAVINTDKTWKIDEKWKPDNAVTADAANVLQD